MNDITAFCFYWTLIYFSSSIVYSLSLCLRVRLVIFWNWINIFSWMSTKDSSTVSNICNIAHLVNYENNYGTTSWSLNWILRLSKGKKLLLCFFEAYFEWLYGLVRKMRILCDLDRQLGTYLCMFYFKKSEHLFPPWPSKTPK